MMDKLHLILPIAGVSAITAGVVIALPAIAMNEPGRPVPPGPQPIVYDEYLTFTALQDSQISLNFDNNSEPEDLGKIPNLNYSFDEQTWTQYQWVSNVGKMISLTSGQKIMFVGDNPQGFSCDMETTEGSIDFTTSFQMSGQFAISGDVMSLIYTKEAKDTSIIPCPYCFYKLFDDCDAITTAEDMTLSAMTLTKGCYRGMFYECNKIVSAPKVLPAKKMADDCYRYMFEFCSKLIDAPKICGEELSKQCYYGMFKDCSDLVTAPELNVTELAEGCYYSMFYDCLDLVNPPALPATKLTKNCYYNMFYKCTRLEVAPYLPATEVVYQCYGSMFRYCSSLHTIKIAFSDNFPSIEPDYSFYIWVSGVASTGTFYYNGTDTTRGTSAIPEGWDIVPF